MRRLLPLRRAAALMLAAALSMAAAFTSEAGAVKPHVPVTLHMDVNSRRTSIYDGYSSYLLGYRASEYDTFTITKDRDDVNLDDVVMNYYLLTYDGETQKYLECTVYGLKEGEHYPVVRPETVEREKSSGDLYDSVDRCYMVEFTYGDARDTRYFTLLPEEDMRVYRNLLLGQWVKVSSGWSYSYQDEHLTNWACINDKWYYFGTDGIMKTGWREYKGDWYYLDPEKGIMRTNCTIDGFKLDDRGVRV